MSTQCNYDCRALLHQAFELMLDEWITSEDAEVGLGIIRCIAMVWFCVGFTLTNSNGRTVDIGSPRNCRGTGEDDGSDQQITPKFSNP